VQHVCAIKDAIGKRQCEGAALMQEDAAVQANPPADHLCGLNVLGRQIDSCHLTTVATGCKTRRSPEPTSNVEHLLFRSEVELAEKIFRSLTAADMEFIYRREIIDCYGIDRFSKRLNSAANRTNQVAMRVVLGNILLHWHCPSPEQSGRSVE
jgi:hypothetical protein